MKLAIMQPYLFPYIGYWQLINAVDTFVIYDDVNFIKKGYINRNYILANMKSQLFTLELIGASQNKPINCIEIGDNIKKLLTTIQRSYSKAPYFDQAFPLIYNILTKKEKGLAKFIGYSIERISEYLCIDTRFVYSSDIEKDNNLKGQEKILDICNLLEASSYINAIGGQSLYDNNKFQEQNLELNFLKTEVIQYDQFENVFLPNLSIIDIIMFNDIDNIKIMFEKFKLIQEG